MENWLFFFKAWCDECNDDWHRNHAARKDHKLIRIQRARKAPPLADANKMIAGMTKNVQGNRPALLSPQARSPQDSAAAVRSPVLSPVFSPAGPTPAARPVPKPRTRRSVNSSTDLTSATATSNPHLQPNVRSGKRHFLNLCLIFCSFLSPGTHFC